MECLLADWGMEVTYRIREVESLEGNTVRIRFVCDCSEFVDVTIVPRKVVMDEDVFVTVFGCEPSFPLAGMGRPDVYYSLVAGFLQLVNEHALLSRAIVRNVGVSEYEVVSSFQDVTLCAFRGGRVEWSSPAAVSIFGDVRFVDWLNVLNGLNNGGDPGPGDSNDPGLG